MAQSNGLPGFGPTPANAVQLNPANTTLSVVGNTGNTKVPNTPIYKYVGNDGVLTYTDQAPQLPAAPTTHATVPPIAAPNAAPGLTQPAALHSPAPSDLLASMYPGVMSLGATPKLNANSPLFAGSANDPLNQNIAPTQQAPQQAAPQSWNSPAFKRNIPQYDLTAGGDLATSLYHGLLSSLAGINPRGPTL